MTGSSHSLLFAFTPKPKSRKHDAKLQAITSAGAVLIILAVLLLPQYAHSQEATGRIVGVVTDAKGAVVPGATVKAINLSTQAARETITNKDGYYQVLDLPIGPYKVVVEHDGFRTEELLPAPLQINQSLRVDARLEVGARDEVINVTSETGNVETVNPTIGASITARPILDMPLNGRNVLDLALLQPGVTDDDNPNNQTNTPGQDLHGHFSIAGGRDDSITFLLDGGINNNLLSNRIVLNPNPDAVAEFRILENSYTAEYGRNGGGVVSVVTKSGTNNFHGSLYDYWRNTDLTANTFFNNLEGLPVPDLKRHQFGATLGGPVEIPHLFEGKNKLFFFLDYQGQRETKALSNPLVTVFTPAELGGDFSHSVNGGPDPGVAAFLLANPQYQGNAVLAANAIIDPTKINTIANNYITANLIPNSPSGSVVPQASALDNVDQLSAKLDANITNSDSVQLTLGLSRENETNPFGTQGVPTVNGFTSATRIHDYFMNLSYTKIISTNLLNVARVVAQRDVQSQDNPLQKLPTASQLGFTGVTPDLSSGPPILDFLDSGVGIGFDFGGPTTLVNDTFQYSDDLTWTRGAHNLKFGFYFAPYENNETFDFLGNGLFGFSGAGAGFTGNERADFLLGLPFEFEQGPNAPSNIRTKQYAFYGQDEWKISKRFVLTVGLRYEYATPKSDTEGRTFSLIPGLQSTVFPNAPPGLLFPGDQGAPRGVNFPDRSNFAPRFGIAFDPFGDGKTSIRTGFGVFYDILKAEDNLQLNGTPPFFAFAGLGGPFPAAAPNLFSDPFGATGAVNPFPSQPVNHNVDFGASGFLPFGGFFGGGPFFVDPHLRTPYVYQYNLSVQRELTHKLTLETNYVGSSGHKLTALQDVNPFNTAGTTRILNPDPSNPLYGPALEFRNVGVSNYNSLQVALRGDLGHSYVGHTYFTFAYTYGHSIDDTSGFQQTRSQQVPSYNPNLLRASSDYDIRHRIVFSGGWDLPFDELWASGPKALTKGWSVYPIVSFRTGFPLDVLCPGCSTSLSDPGPSGFGDGGVARANLVGNSVQILNPYKSGTLQWVSAANFDPAVTSGYGTLGRNAFRGPGRFNFDMSLGKTFTFHHDRVGAEFHADYFNVLNNTQFQSIDTGLADSRFGQVTSTYPQRIGQLALKIRF